MTDLGATSGAGVAGYAGSAGFGDPRPAGPAGGPAAPAGSGPAPSGQARSAAGSAAPAYTGDGFGPVAPAGSAVPGFGAVAAPASPSPAARRRRAHARTRRPVKPVADSPSTRFAHLSVVPDVEGPRVRLGILWAAVTFVAAVAGALWIGVCLGLVGGVAAAQAARSWRSQPRRPHPGVAAAGGLLLPLASIAGPVPAAIALVAVAVASFAVGPLRAAAGKPTRGRLSGPLTLALGASVGAAAAAPVLARHLGVVEVLVLLTLVAVYDASNYLIGSGASNLWEGPAAGVAFIAVVTLAVAAIFVPPFRGATPWLLGLLAAVLTPAGPMAATALTGSRDAPVPALRRLDSLLLTGPAWVALAALTVS